jgi:type II secretory pathway component PulF
MRKRAAFYMQLAHMLQAGIGVGRCLRTLAGQGGSRRLARAAAAMARHVEAGNRLSEALAQHPDIFLANEMRMIEGAEHAGKEPDVMLRIARLLDRRASARNKVLAGLIYPGLCLFAALVALPLVVAYLTGGSAAMWALLRSQLTTLGIALAVWFALFVGFRSLSERAATRVGVHAAALSIPLFGKLFRRLALARFADTLESLYSAGVMMPEAVGRAATACGNAYIGGRIERAVPAVTRGGSLAGALAQSGVIPQMGLNFIEVGEQSGKLDASLAKFAEYQHEDLEMGIERLSKILPTIAIFLMIIILAYMVITRWMAHFETIRGLMGS